MKGWLAFIVIVLFLMGFVVAEPYADITSAAVESQCENEGGVCMNADEECIKGYYNSSLLCNFASEICCLKISSGLRGINAEKARQIVKDRNRLKITDKYIECPTACTCAGSTIKCQLENGREMTVIAGNSGNMMVQVKGENMSTSVTLYKHSDGKLYGVFKNNETRAVRMLPDQVQARIREKLRVRLHNENMTLNENGEYEYRAGKEARLFFVFRIKERVTARINAETGEVTELKSAWWGFLAKDVKETILGASCGTVTPGQNDACCQNKGYDLWNSEKQECGFAE